MLNSEDPANWVQLAGHEFPSTTLDSRRLISAPKSAEEPLKAGILDPPVASSTKMIKPRMDLDIDLRGGVRIGSGKARFERDSMLAIDVKIISAELKRDGRRAGE